MLFECILVPSINCDKDLHSYLSAVVYPFACDLILHNITPYLRPCEQYQSSSPNFQSLRLQDMISPMLAIIIPCLFIATLLLAIMFYYIAVVHCQYAPVEVL